MEKLLLKPNEAAELLGVGRSKMYELLSTEKVPSIKIGGSIRIPTKALTEWVEKQHSESAGNGSGSRLMRSGTSN